MRAKQPNQYTKPAKPKASAFGAQSARRAGSIGRLIIGIDPGTAQCAIATTEILYGDPDRTPNVKLSDGWVGFYLNQNYTPSTAVYYKDDGAVDTGDCLNYLFDDTNPDAFQTSSSGLNVESNVSRSSE